RADDPVQPIAGSIALRLRLAFGAVAATTLIACTAAIWAFRSVETTFKHVSGHSFPATVAASRLQASSQELSSTLVALAAAATPDSRKAAQDRVRGLLAALTQQIAGIAEGQGAAAAELRGMVDVLSRNAEE